MAGKVTMDDIAQKLGISKSLVSRALADKYGVSDEMRTRIRLTALKMGYEFRTSISRKAEKPETMVHVAVLLTRGTLHDDMFYYQMISGIEKCLSEHKIQFFLKIIEDADIQSHMISISYVKSSGILVLGKMNQEIVLAVASTGLPFVLVDTYDLSSRVDRITTNNFDSAYAAMDYLYEQGHRHIAFLGSSAYSSSFDERRWGVKRFSEEHTDVQVDYLCNVHESNTYPVDLLQMEQYLCAEKRATAFFCANDAIAVLLYERAQKQNIRIPEDISVMGFDDIPNAEWLTPGLTTVKVLKAEIGYLGAKRIMDKIEKKDDIIQYIQVDGDIIVRDSVLNRSLMNG